MPAGVKDIYFILVVILFSLGCQGEKFYSNHWQNPIPEQGSPPSHYSPIEASLEPESCGTCHREQFESWRNSLHSKSMTEGFLWQMEGLGLENSKTCMKCHSPLQETQSFVLKSKNLIQAYPVRYETYLSSKSNHQGIICASCHVRGHVRLGPRPIDNHLPGSAPHGGFEIRDEFENSKFCKSCHESPEDGKRINGKKQMEIYTEWSNSKFASEGVTCQNCHMPNRKHEWKGIHDKEFVLSGVKIEINKIQESNSIILMGKINSTRIGHSFPGYSVPKVFMRIIEEDFQKRRKVLNEEVVGRMMDTSHSEEYFDTRIKPGEEKTIFHQLIQLEQSKKYFFEVWVEPDETYQRFFEEETHKNIISIDSKNQLEKSLMNVKSSGYLLHKSRF